MRRRISLTRIVILVAVVAGLASVAWSQGDRAYQRLTAGRATTWFAPYVDVTLTPTFHFEDPLVSPSRTHVLGFVVADRRDRCLPTWGTHYDLDGAGRALDLDRRIVRLRERGGDVVVSFGGAVNDELAVACTDPARLKAAYASVVKRYEAGTVDFDLEGAALSDAAANARRATAVKALQDAAGTAHPLQVWLTLPVTPAGLTPEGLAVVDGMLSSGVRLAGVNVMTMNYGGSRPAGTTMADASSQALTATQRQLGASYRRVGAILSQSDLWRRVGATPMIGRNDVDPDVATIGDARSLVDFALRQKLGRVSMWSANRDQSCGVTADRDRVSNTCSGVDQKPLGFTWEFSRLDGPLPNRTPADEPAGRAVTIARDDPARTPYPIWRSEKQYKTGSKVVWHGNVYQSKWFSQADLPDAPVAKPWNTPWMYVGPVLPTDTPSAPPRVSGHPQRWSADGVYLRGDRVERNGFVYSAKWYTQGDVPVADPDRPDESPWTLVGRAAPDVAVVSGQYSPWSPAKQYLPGSRVSFRGYAFEAQWWTRGSRPNPTPRRPDSAAWTVIGRLKTR